MLGSTWLIVSGTPKNSLIDLDSYAESRASSIPMDIDQMCLSGLEFSCFVSRIYLRPSSSSHCSSSKSLRHIVTTLRHLLLSIDLKVLLELSNFCIEMNLLVGCAAALGRELQFLKSLCHDVEFGLFSFHSIYQELLSDTLIDEETVSSTISDQVCLVHLNLMHNLKALRAY